MLRQKHAAALITRLAKLLRSRFVAEKLVNRLLTRDVGRDCTTVARFTVGPAAGGPDGYQLPVFTGGTSGYGFLPSWNINVDGNQTENNSNARRTYQVACETARDAIDGGLVMPACTWARTG